MAEKVIYTVGHSTHPLEDFLRMLKSFGIEQLIDIRRLPGWRNASFQGYADYMETDEFKIAAGKLEETAISKPTVYMCAEAVWWRCHRSMVSDYLKAKGWTVWHIMAEGKAQEHKYTAPARIVGDHVSYSD